MHIANPNACDHLYEWSYNIGGYTHTAAMVAAGFGTGLGAGAATEEGVVAGGDAAGSGAGQDFGRQLVSRLKTLMSDDTGSIGPGTGNLKFARSVKLDVNNPAVANRQMSAREFISQYRDAKVLREFPGEYLDGSVEDALRSGDSTVRKLLTDGRWSR